MSSQSHFISNVLFNEVTTDTLGLMQFE